MSVRVITLRKTAAAQFRDYHNRATNTLEPQKWPAWMVELDSAIDDAATRSIILVIDSPGGKLSKTGQRKSVVISGPDTTNEA